MGKRIVELIIGKSGETDMGRPQTNYLRSRKPHGGMINLKNTQCATITNPHTSTSEWNPQQSHLGWRQHALPNPHRQVNPWRWPKVPRTIHQAATGTFRMAPLIFPSFQRVFSTIFVLPLAAFLVRKQAITLPSLALATAKQVSKSQSSFAKSLGIRSQHTCLINLITDGHYMSYGHMQLSSNSIGTSMIHKASDCWSVGMTSLPWFPQQFVSVMFRTPKLL